MSPLPRKKSFFHRPFVGLACVLAISGIGAIPRAALGRQNAAAVPNTLTAAEKAGGWVLLFDGRTLSGWRGLGYDHVPEKHWIVRDGAIELLPAGSVPLLPDGQPAQGGDLLTIETFRDFELAFEWKISPGGNSGVKYNVSEELSMAQAPNHAALGFEYQVLDDDLHPDAKNGPNRTAAALYDLVAPAGRKLRPVGEWNTAEIVFRGSRGEHWLNGVKVLEFDTASADFRGRLAKSKYAKIPGFAERRKGPIVLQDHTDAVWFRSLKIRKLG